MSKEGLVADFMKLRKKVQQAALRTKAGSAVIISNQRLRRVDSRHLDFTR